MPQNEVRIRNLFVTTIVNLGHQMLTLLNLCSVCGVVQQRSTAVFRAFDNLRRENVTMVVKSHVGDSVTDVAARKVEPFLYEFEFSQPNKVIGILEIYVDDEQIPESPIQVQVIDRDCEIAFLGKNKVPVSLCA